MMKYKTGQVVLNAFSNPDSQNRVLAYLLKISKSPDPAELKKRLGDLPLTLYKNISGEKAEIIVRNLNKLGAYATFLPNVENSHGTSNVASAAGQTGSRGTAGPVQTLRRPVLKTSPPEPKKSWGPVRTALCAALVFTLIFFFYAQHKGGHQFISTLLSPVSSEPGTRADNRSNGASGLSIPSGSLYADHIRQYTVSPDRTIIGAFNQLIEIYGSLQGFPGEINLFRSGPVQYNEHEVLLALLKGDRIISEIRIPRPLNPAKALSSMHQWLEAMEDQNPLKIAAAVRDKTWKEELGLALADFGNLDPRLVIRGLLNLEKLWQEQGPDPRILLAAVRGYAILTFVLQPDPVDYKDDFASRALALLALTKKLDPTLPVAREEAFLSMILGYMAHADKLIDSSEVQLFSPLDHAFRAFIKEDVDGLRQHIRADAELLELYLLARLYRRMELFKEAEKISIHLLNKFPHLYPAVVETIYSANLVAAKQLSTVYPLDILARLEGQVKPDAIETAAAWGKRVEVFAGRSAEGNVSFSQFEDLLAKWEPLKEYGQFGLLVDETQIKQVFRTLYTGAVYLRFNVLMNRWAVLDRATNYVKSFATADPEHPMVMFMQLKVQVESGNRPAADATCEKVLQHPQASAWIATRAHYLFDDKLKQIKATPAVVLKMDSRPSNLIQLGRIFTRLRHYDYSEKFYLLALARNPLQYQTYVDLAWVTGDDEPVLTAIEQFSDNAMMLAKAGDYFAKKVDLHSIAKAVDLYRRAVDMQPTSKNHSQKLARSLRKLKRYDEAVQVLQAWIDRNGGDDLTTTIYKGSVARVYLEMGQPDMALQTLETEMGSYQSGVMTTIAAAYTMRNERDLAEAMYRKALDRYPQSSHVLASFAGFYWEIGRAKDAAELIARGRKINGESSRWYFTDFIKAFEQAPSDEILAAIDSLQTAGAISLETSGLAYRFADKDRYEIAIKILQQIPVPKPMLRLERAVIIYDITRRWKGEEAARHDLFQRVPPQMHGPLTLALFKKGHFPLIMELLENPDSFQWQYREFMWLIKLMAWIAENEQPASLQNQLYRHYETDSKDHYHAIGRYMLGKISQADLLARIESPKQRCEISYYIGFAERARGNFSDAAIWYQICRETMLSNNGEFHWASTELFWWAHTGTHNRHRLLRDDINDYRRKYDSMSSI